MRKICIKSTPKVNLRSHNVNILKLLNPSGKVRLVRGDVFKFQNLSIGIYLQLMANAFNAF